MKGVPPSSPRPSNAPPTQAVDHQAVIVGVDFLMNEKSLPAANVVMDNVPEKKATSDLVCCSYNLRPRGR